LTSPGGGATGLPRFREELGPFVGIFGAMSAGGSWGGLVSSQLRATGSLAAGLRLGFGAESVPREPHGAGLTLAWNVFLRGQFDGRYFLGDREDLKPSNH
jgi:hypothetical protein